MKRWAQSQMLLPNKDGERMRVLFDNYFCFVLLLLVYVYVYVRGVAECIL
jgi:hypothetical protein